MGTGFHPELTGRENIYLNGAILGHDAGPRSTASSTRSSTSPEVEQFLDTPVKRYSQRHVRAAGVRGGRAPRAGDPDRRRGAGGRRRGVPEEVPGEDGRGGAAAGRTVLFVSHNMAAVQNLCTRSVVLAKGECVFDGPVSAAIDHYLSDMRRSRGAVALGAVTDRTGNQAARFTSVHFEDDSGFRINTISMGGPLNIVMAFECRQPLSNLDFGVVVSDSVDQRIFRILTAQSLDRGLPTCHTGGEIRCRVPRLMLVPDTYSVTIGMAQGEEIVDHIGGAATFSVTEADVFGTGRFPTRLGGPFSWTANGNSARSRWATTLPCAQCDQARGADRGGVAELGVDACG